MLGVTFTNDLSIAPHVQHLAISNAQVMYALKYCVLMAYVRGQYRQFPFRNASTAFICFTCMVEICRSARQAKALRVSAPQLPAWFLLPGSAQLRWLMLPGRPAACSKKYYIIQNMSYVVYFPLFLTPCTISESVHMTVLPGLFSCLADSNVRMLFYEAYWQHSVYLCVICATFIAISSLRLRFVS